MLGRKKSASITEIKYNFDIQVRAIILKKPSNTIDGTISVLLERGSKYLSTGEKESRLDSNGDACANFAEVLNLEATMYFANNNFQEKVAKLSIRKKKRGLMTSHSVIGTVSLPLHTIIEENEQPLDKSYLLENCSFPGSKINLLIKFRRADGKPNLPSQVAVVDKSKVRNSNQNNNNNNSLKYFHIKIGNS
jgi:hypothetical protein